MIALRRMAFVVVLAGCAVPELDRGGAIRCGATTEPNGGCPQGYACSAGRCCPGDAGACPRLETACEGPSCSTTGLITGKPCTTLVQCLNPAMGEGPACATGANIPGGYCSATCRTVGAACGNGQGICVSARGLLGLAQGGVCLRACRLPAGETVARCRNTEGGPTDSYVCVTVPGTTFTACVPDCKVTGCQSGQVCDERSRVCVFPDGRI